MSTSLRAPEDAADQKHEPEWREPPGRLGEYVRRVKQRSATPQTKRERDQIED
jgi:hypothetical protein